MDEQLWYLCRGNEQFGPFSTADLKHWIRQGEISADDYVWTEEWETWLQVARPTFAAVFHCRLMQWSQRRSNRQRNTDCQGWRQRSYPCWRLLCCFGSSSPAIADLAEPAEASYRQNWNSWQRRDKTKVAFRGGHPSLTSRLPNNLKRRSHMHRLKRPETVYWFSSFTNLTASPSNRWTRKPQAGSSGRVRPRIREGGIVRVRMRESPSRRRAREA